jgi:hypothetical protein
MADTTETPNLFNPFLAWADLGMRAAEMAVAGAQKITDGADRVTRAVAGTEADEIVDDAAPAQTAGWPVAGLNGWASMQRLAWDLMAQNWVRWLSTAGNLMSASAGEGVTRKGRTSMLAPEHAQAADEPKPRRRSTAKPRRAQRASRS